MGKGKVPCKTLGCAAQDEEPNFPHWALQLYKPRVIYVRKSNKALKTYNEDAQRNASADRTACRHRNSHQDVKYQRSVLSKRSRVQVETEDINRGYYQPL